MNWKEEVTEKLRKYSLMANAAVSIPAELKSLEQEACAIQSAQAGGCRSRSVRGYEDRLLNILVKQQELGLLLDSVESWIKVMDAAMKKLSTGEKRVLELMFIQKMPVQQVCDELRMERSSLYRYRDMALKNLTLNIYGALES